MAFRMPHPVALGNGIYHLNVRVPADIADGVKGTRIALPIAGATVGIRDKVIVSLRTKDARVAKERFADAHAALEKHWRFVRTAPTPLTHKQVMGIAGLFYHQQVAGFENDPAITPEARNEERAAFCAEINAWRGGADAERLADATDDAGPGQGPLPDDFTDERAEAEAAIRTLMSMRHGDALLAYRSESGVSIGSIAITYDQALDRFFGRALDRLSARIGIKADDETRRRILREIGSAYRLAEAKMFRNFDGGCSEDSAAKRFPPFHSPVHEETRSPPSPALEGVTALYERWSAKQQGKKSQSTIRRYGPPLMSDPPPLQWSALKYGFCAWRTDQWQYKA